MPSTVIDFPPFRLDLTALQLRRGDQPIPLRAKSLAVLRYLAERPGELVTQEALLDAIWPGLAVTRDVVRQSASEIRAVLGDDRFSPRYLETVPRLGYRFIAPVRRGLAVGSVPVAEPGAPIAEATGDSRNPSVLVVGREVERAAIAAWSGVAIAGRRQLVFVTGETGIGKTTLVEAAVRELQRRSHVRVARAQCVEQYGGSDPFKPVVDALATLCHGPHSVPIETVLRARAPEWLLDALRSASPRLLDGVSDHELPTPPPETDHTLHRLASCVTALAEDMPLVLVFEDVHWSDPSTLDLLSALAHDRSPARLLVVCTLRPADAIARAHPLMAVKRELLRKGACNELSLGGLSRGDVAAYLARRFPEAVLPNGLLSTLWDRSDGNPFFLVTLVDHLLERGTLVVTAKALELRGSLDALRTVIPDGLYAVVEPRLERLTADERLALDAASLAGVEFEAQLVAGLMPPESDLADVEAIEQLCDRLVRRHDILRASGEAVWPNGTTSACYAFQHGLYRQVLDRSLGVSQRRRLHRAIGERLEAGWVGRTDEVASRLASHAEQAGDVERAVRHHAEAASRARARFAFQETRLHVESGLRLVREQPETAEGLSRQVSLLDDLTWSSFAHRGWGDEEAARAIVRMRELSERLDDAAERAKATAGELVMLSMRAEYAAARRLGEEMLALAEQSGDRAAITALTPLGATWLHLGELEATIELGERMVAACDPNEQSIVAVSCHILLAPPYAHLGLVARASEMTRGAMAIAARSDVPYVQALAATYSAAADLIVRDSASARPRAQAAAQIADEHGFAVLNCLGRLFLGWCDVYEGRATGAIAGLHAAFDEYVTLGQRGSTSAHCLPLAEAHIAAGALDGADAALDFAFAFVEETGETLMEHELHRLRGECLLARAVTGGGRRRARAQAIDHFERAIALAEARKGLLFELRAATSLHRVEPKAVRDRLAGLVARFAPEDDCADLRAAIAALHG